ncbi:DUF222 domain-containing protein [Micrococcaceae sp. AOP34-BR2-30]
MTTTDTSTLLPLLDALDDLSSSDLATLLTQGLTTLSRRVSSAEAREEFSLYQRQNPDAHQDWGTSFLDHADTRTKPGSKQDPQGEITIEDPAGSLPVMIEQAAALGRLCENIETALARVVDQVFATHEQRLELLGLPTGRVVHKNASEFLRHHTHCAFGVAKQRIRLGNKIFPRTDITAFTGDPSTVVAELPQVGEASTEGEITTKAVKAIVDDLEAVEEQAQSVSTDPEDLEELLQDGEEVLVEQAKVFDDNQFAHYATGWKDRTEAKVNPDGQAPDDREAQKKRGFRRVRRLGKLSVWQCTTDQAGSELFETLVHAINNPRAKTGSHTGADATNAVDANGDTVNNLDRRSREQKAHDALIGVLQAGLKVPHNKLPDQGGTRPQVLVTIDLPLMLRMMVQAGIAPKNFDPAWLTDGTLPSFELSQGAYTGPISPANIRHLLCEAEILPVVLGGAGQILDVGTSERFFDKHLRKALVARDGGCAAPGCTAPAPWCESHHIDPARAQGPTSTANGVLLCHHDHRLADRGDWRISIVDDVPWFTAPPYIDPDQIPRRNTYWRPLRQ